MLYTPVVAGHRAATIFGLVLLDRVYCIDICAVLVCMIAVLWAECGIRIVGFGVGISGLKLMGGMNAGIDDAGFTVFKCCLGFTMLAVCFLNCNISGIL